MKKLTTAINYLLVQPDELPPAEQALVQKAIDATNNSYARYSNFHVGAACLLENGNVVIGANQENAAFPSGLCAERTAIFAAQAKVSAFCLAKTGLMHGATFTQPRTVFANIGQAKNRLVWRR